MESRHTHAHRCPASAVGRPRGAPRRSHELHRLALNRRRQRSFRAQRPSVHSPHGARSGVLARKRTDGPRTTRRCGATWSLRRRWDSMVCASIRRSRIRAITTGPTSSDLLVWEEMPSAYRFADRSVQRVSREWIAAIERDTSHPCIIAWVPINESWGVPNLPTSAAERHYVQGLYHLTKTLDPTRPVDRQRRLGKRRDRHHRHSRLRQRSRSDCQALSRRRSAAAAVQAGAAGRAAARARRRQSAAISR